MTKSDKHGVGKATASGRLAPHAALAPKKAIRQTVVNHRLVALILTHEEAASRLRVQRNPVDGSQGEAQQAECLRGTEDGHLSQSCCPPWEKRQQSTVGNDYVRPKGFRNSVEEEDALKLGQSGRHALRFQLSGSPQVFGALLDSTLNEGTRLSAEEAEAVIDRINAADLQLPRCESCRPDFDVGMKNEPLQLS
jgi:hypothetical protein